MFIILDFQNAYCITNETPYAPFSRWIAMCNAMLYGCGCLLFDTFCFGVFHQPNAILAII
jgi:hypothetical protein